MVMPSIFVGANLSFVERN